MWCDFSRRIIWLFIHDVLLHANSFIFSLYYCVTLYSFNFFLFFFILWGLMSTVGPRFVLHADPKFGLRWNMGALPRTPDYLVCRIRFQSTLICFTLLCLFFFGAGECLFLSDVLKINQNVLFFVLFLFYYFFFFPLFVFVQGSRTVWLLSSWNVGYVAGRRHGVDWHARSVHLARHGVCRLRVGRLPTPWQDTLLRTANSGSFARRQI